MKKITITVDGMHCPKCAAKVEAAIADKYAVKSVSVSHTDKTATVLTEIALDHESIAATVKAVGFTVTDIKSEDVEKKGVLAKIFKKK